MYFLVFRWCRYQWLCTYISTPLAVSSTNKQWIHILIFFLKKKKKKKTNRKKKKKEKKKKYKEKLKYTKIKEKNPITIQNNH